MKFEPGDSIGYWFKKSAVPFQHYPDNDIRCKEYGDAIQHSFSSYKSMYEFQVLNDGERCRMYAYSALLSKYGVYKVY